MTEVVPDLNPPTKVARKPRDPNAPKKERAPRQNYGFHEDSIIELVQGKEIKYRDGNRKAWYEKVLAYAGRPVKEYMSGYKNEKDPPRGWLRFFVQDGAVVLTKPN